MKPKNAYLFFVIVLGFQAFVTAQSNPSKYVGYKYAGVIPNKTLPNGVKHLGGGLIGDINAEPVYGISQVEKGKTKMLWFEVSTGQNNTGVTGWKVLDVVAFSNLKRTDYVFFFGDPGINCKREGRDLENLVGVGQILRRQGTFKPTKLWVADLQIKKFAPLPITGVKCEYSEP